MHRLFAAALAWSCWLGLVVSAWAQSAKTPLDEYVHRPDPSYRWKVVRTARDGNLTVFVVDMISQSWRSPKEVNRTQWQHWLIVLVPDKVKYDTALLYIGGGRNGGRPPGGADSMLHMIAKRSGGVVAMLRMVPNQPLVFHGDGKPRVEDDLVSYTWVQYLKTGDPTWPARNPMVKSAVRAMDTITALLAQKQAGGHRVDKFVVAGASKRGWTTWLTGAVDDRVVAIAPIVIDVLNMQRSMHHHWAAYGFWAPAVDDYVRTEIFSWFGSQELLNLQKLVDPYFYRHRLRKPKYIMNSAGDQFFLPDSSQFYFDDLPGEKYLRYYPNSDHGLKGTTAPQDLLAWFVMIARGTPRPNITWRYRDAHTLEVTASTAPVKVLLWQATNPEKRDFRLEALGPKYVSRPVEPTGHGVYRVRVPDPPQGWTAYFLEFAFDVGAGVPWHITTPVRVVPETLPFKNKKFPMTRGTRPARSLPAGSGMGR